MGRRSGGRGPRRAARHLALAPALAALLLASSACAASQSGLSVGDLRTIARRVDGGGAECPLSIPAAVLRPSTVSASVPVRPDISNPSHASVGTIGSDVPGSGLARDDGVLLVCRYLAGPVRVTVRVVGVGKGQASAHLFGTMLALGKMSRSQGAAFLDTVVHLPHGAAAPLPPRAHAAFAVVAGDRSNVALLLSVSSTTGAPTPLPSSQDLVAPAAAIARLLAS
jgi:hypothetical protein